MTDYVLQFDKPVGYFENESDFLHCQVDYMGKVMNYAQFLKQPLTLGMFVPCDENGNALPEPQMRPEKNSFDEEDMDYDVQELYEYIEAKKRVLFKGAEILEEKDGNETNYYLILSGMSILNKIQGYNWETSPGFERVETLLDFDNIELTESAIKQLV